MQVASPARTVVVLARGHPEAWAQISAQDPGIVLVQPAILARPQGFFSLTYVRVCVIRRASF